MISSLTKDEKLLIKICQIHSHQTNENIPNSSKVEQIKAYENDENLFKKSRHILCNKTKHVKLMKTYQTSQNVLN